MCNHDASDAAAGLAEADAAVGQFGQRSLLRNPATKCKVARKLGALKRKGQESWDPKRFTNPQAHRPDRYAYLVNAVAEYEQDPPYIGALLNDPGSIKYNLLSCSAVNDQRHGTWAPSGLILKVPQENVVAAHHQDLGTNNSLMGNGDPAPLYGHLRDRMGQYNPEGRLRDPGEVLMAGQKSGYPPRYRHNEIVVAGTTRTGGQTHEVEIVGVFVFVDEAPADPAQTPTPLTLYEPLRDENGHPIREGVKPVMKPVPGVSPERMQRLADVAQGMHVPWVPLKLSEECWTSSFGNTRRPLLPGEVVRYARQGLVEAPPPDEPPPLRPDVAAAPPPDEPAPLPPDVAAAPPPPMDPPPIPEGGHS